MGQINPKLSNDKKDPSKNSYEKDQKIIGGIDWETIQEDLKKELG